MKNMLRPDPGTMTEKVEIFLRRLKETHSEQTCDKYSRCLWDYIEFLGDREPDERGIYDWLDIHPGWSKSSRKVAICALRKFFEWERGKETSPAHRIPIPRSEQTPQRSLKADQMFQILASIDTSTDLGRRNMALLLIMLDSGLRSSEVCRLRLVDINLADRHFDVAVKGGRWEEGIFSDYTADWLKIWINVRRLYVQPGIKTVFVSVGGNTPGKSLTRYGLTVIFRRIGKDAGIYPFSPHDLRRSFAMLTLEAGASSRMLQLLGRWRKLEMVERYTANLKAHQMRTPFASDYIMDLEHITDD